MFRSEGEKAPQQEEQEAGKKVQVEEEGKKESPSLS